MLQIALLISVLIAIMTIQTQKLRQSVIFMGVFSLMISFVYSLYHAPDVAMAEAIIGSAIATIIYIITLQKYQLFIVYVAIMGIELDDDLMKYGEDSSLLEQIEIFCIKESLESQVIFTTEEVSTIDEHHDYAIIIKPNGNSNYTIYTHEENYKDQKLQQYLSHKLKRKYAIKFDKLLSDTRGS